MILFCADSKRCFNELAPFFGETILPLKEDNSTGTDADCDLKTFIVKVGDIVCGHTVKVGFENNRVNSTCKILIDLPKGGLDASQFKAAIQKRVIVVLPFEDKPISMRLLFEILRKLEEIDGRIKIKGNYLAIRGMILGDKTESADEFKEYFHRLVSSCEQVDLSRNDVFTWDQLKAVVEVVTECVRDPESIFRSVEFPRGLKGEVPDGEHLRKSLKELFDAVMSTYDRSNVTRIQFPKAPFYFCAEQILVEHAAQLKSICMLASNFYFYDDDCFAKKLNPSPKQNKFLEPLSCIERFFMCSSPLGDVKRCDDWETYSERLDPGWSELLRETLFIWRKFIQCYFEDGFLLREDNFIFHEKHKFRNRSWLQIRKMIDHATVCLVQMGESGKLSGLPNIREMVESHLKQLGADLEGKILPEDDSVNEFYSETRALLRDLARGI